MPNDISISTPDQSYTVQVMPPGQAARLPNWLGSGGARAIIQTACDHGHLFYTLPEHFQSGRDSGMISQDILRRYCQYLAAGTVGAAWPHPVAEGPLLDGWHQIANRDASNPATLGDRLPDVISEFMDLPMFATPESRRAAGIPEAWNLDPETASEVFADYFITCEHCECIYMRQRITHYACGDSDSHSGRVCQDCTESGDLAYASDTGEYYRDASNLRWDDDAGEYYASERDSEDYGNPPCYSYGTNVLDVHGWPSRTPADALAFGVELECEPRPGHGQDDLSDALGGRDGNGRYILKEDGSLNSGCELVTLPYTLDDHRTYFDWQEILDSQVHRVGKSGAGTNNCGIHIHVNRRALSPLTIGKVLVFLNSADNADLVTAIAQRRSNGYCQRDTRKKLTDTQGGSRYDLLNVSGRHTVEFRLFRGNLRPERVLKNLEFCHAIITFAAGHGIKASASGKKFLAWIAERTAQYPHLYAFLREIGQIGDEMRGRTTDAPALAAIADA